MLITIYERLHVCAFSHFHREIGRWVCNADAYTRYIEWIKHYLKRKYRLNPIEAICTQLLHNLNDIAFNFNVTKSVHDVCEDVYVCVRAWAREREFVCVWHSFESSHSQSTHKSGTEGWWGNGKAYKHIAEQQRKYH